MAEEHRCLEQKLCVNNCGFFGSPTTQNLCSKCYRDLQHKEQQALSLNQTFISTSAAASASSTSQPSSSSSSSSAFYPSSPVSVSSPQNERVVVDTKIEEGKKQEVVPAVEGAAANKPNRCTTCRRRVGLTGFKCRCGMTFCGTHRYPEQHACGFDFRSMGKEQIAKANPVIKGEKLQKI
ncbi:zinc finger A20 and AN1 domain-containing stress-associated protein 3 [Argentina anserina]|uniref:zinc finger A20 and AN1 domain-containing stress-associated protein 3 n=1 Tax=Argentina anserina TaxID=57926 RepID=UPI0021769257|nr:zinc finger A20 and AN1 domain-containing stress-associated protein 3 [Potentilla anserina]